MLWRDSNAVFHNVPFQNGTTGRKPAGKPPKILAQEIADHLQAALEQFSAIAAELSDESGRLK